MIKNNTYKVGDIVSVDVEYLYSQKGNQLEYGKIIVENDEHGNPYYFDIYNDFSCACMSGEDAEIVMIGVDTITLKNNMGNIAVIFKLTKEEFEIACC